TTSGKDFANYTNGNVTGTKLDDSTGNGLGGWTIRAYTDDGNGMLSAAEAAAGPVASVTTASGTGAYSLSLKPGAYVICEGFQPNWLQTRPANNACLS